MTYPSRKASRCLVEWIAGLTTVIQPSERTEFEDAIDSFQFESKYPTDNGLTQRAPDWWEAARFQAVSVAWSWFRQNDVIPSRPPAGNAHR
jgi:hypothetical protein